MDEWFPPEREELYPRLGKPRLGKNEHGLLFVRGKGVAVAVVLGRVALGREPSEILAEFPSLDRDDYEECIRFAADIASVLLLPPAA